MRASVYSTEVSGRCLWASAVLTLPHKHEAKRKQGTTLLRSTLYNPKKPNENSNQCRMSVHLCCFYPQDANFRRYAQTPN